MSESRGPVGYPNSFRSRNPGSPGQLRGEILSKISAHLLARGLSASTLERSPSLFNISLPFRESGDSKSPDIAKARTRVAWKRKNLRKCRQFQ